MFLKLLFCRSQLFGSILSCSAMDVTAMSRLARAACTAAVNHELDDSFFRIRTAEKVEAENVKLRKVVFRLVRSLMALEPLLDVPPRAFIHVTLAQLGLPWEDVVGSDWEEMLLCGRNHREGVDLGSNVEDHFLRAIEEEVPLEDQDGGNLGAQLVANRMARLSTWGLTSESTVAMHNCIMEQRVAELVLSAMD